ncbi:MAG: ABC transporter ATP-binding protein/permease, partial [Oscillospiraceae bacterium]|nr:ABC transporter ATP-binding protein/permease [Oscillospiraceae bacterium]
MSDDNKIKRNDEKGNVDSVGGVEGTAKKYTLRENIHLIVRGYKILNSLPKPLLMSSALSSVFEAALPFVNIFFSAQILNELAGARDTGRLLLLVLLTAGLNLAAALASNALKRWHLYINSNSYHMIKKIYSDKMLTLDYIDAEDPAVQNDFNEIIRHHNGMGFGLSRLTWPLPVLAKGIIQIAMSSALAFTLFTQKMPIGSPYAWLDSPLAAVGVLLILCGPILLAPYLNMIGGKVWALATHDNNKGNRYFLFYFFSMIEGSGAAKDIRIYDQIRLAEKQFENYSFLNINSNKGQPSKWLHYCRYNAKYVSIGTAVTYLCNGLIYLFVALKSMSGAFGVGGIVLYVGAVTQFSMGFSAMLSGIAEIFSNNPFLDMVCQFLDYPNAMYQGSLTTEKRSDKKYEIEFRNVSFKYPSSDAYALQNVSLKLSVGRRLAVVGENGSGKTTFIKLLCRLYDPDEGEILLNGIDIKKYNYGEYMDI